MHPYVRVLQTYLGSLGGSDYGPQRVIQRPDLPW
jgi:hypothetical protein